MTSFVNMDMMRELTWQEKALRIHWLLLAILLVVGVFGVVMLYSIAGGSFSPWALTQMVRLFICLLFVIMLGMVDLRIWLMLAYPFYGICLALLLGVEFFPARGMGAERWLEVMSFRFQPSELMRIGIVLALARYYHYLEPEKISLPHYLIIPALLIMAPLLLVIRQPDLGTALMLMVIGASIMFLAGLHWRYFAAAMVSLVIILPLLWHGMREYQRQRILIFLDPERDPMGGGYHILQSKIAMGAGGLFGMGLGGGTQSNLNFLPEKHTDFIFTSLAEELGMVGGMFLLGLYIALVVIGFRIALSASSNFARLLCLGLIFSFFLYCFVNIAMVMGMLPVVGVPLPLISYGGTSMLTIMAGFGIIMAVHIHAHDEMPRNF